MRSIIFGIFLIALGACSSTTTPSGGTMTPIQAAGCDIESALLGGASGAIAQGLNCSNPSSIQASLTVAIGNANLCATPIPATSTAPSTGKKVEAPAWKTLGDVPGSALHPSTDSKSASTGRQLGLVGAIACPIAINTVMGFLSNSVPQAWGCSSSATAAAVSAALVASCEVAVPI